MVTFLTVFPNSMFPATGFRCTGLPRVSTSLLGEGVYHVHGEWEGVAMRWSLTGLLLLVVLALVGGSLGGGQQVPLYIFLPRAFSLGEVA